MTKNIKKTSVIRGNRAKACPFGLPIPIACCNVGECVKRMAPIEISKDKQESIKRANSMVYIHHKTGKRCPFADKVLEEFDKVDCDFGDTGQGQKSVQFRGSPLYPQTFSGIGLDGLYGYPLGFYADNNESRNLFFGLFSFLGKEKLDGLVKLADKYDECGEKEKADTIDKILERLQDISEEFEEEFHNLEEHLSKYRSEYESGRTDSGMLWDLAEKWFGPRQVNK